MKFVFFGPQNGQPNYNMVRTLFDMPSVCKIGCKHVLTPYLLKKLSYRTKLFNAAIFKYLNRKLKKEDIGRNDEIIFVYYEPWYILLMQIGYLSYLKRKYIKSSHVCMLSDCIVAKGLQMDSLKNNYDKVYLYDLDESRKLGVDYLRPAYSKNYETPKIEDEMFDVSFVGHAKNRLKDILKIYDTLTELGLSCRFYIVNVKKSDRINRPGIIYANRYLKEKEYFESYIKPARCMLEIANPETSALTARVREAIMYDKKLISNNPDVENSKYYNHSMIYIIGQDKDFDAFFIKADKVSYNYEGDFEPIHMLTRLKEDYLDGLMSNEKVEVNDEKE